MKPMLKPFWQNIIRLIVNLTWAGVEKGLQVVF